MVPRDRWLIAPKIPTIVFVAISVHSKALTLSEPSWVGGTRGATQRGFLRRGRFAVHTAYAVQAWELLFGLHLYVPFLMVRFWARRRAPTL